MLAFSILCLPFESLILLRIFAFRTTLLYICILLFGNVRTMIKIIGSVVVLCVLWGCGSRGNVDAVLDAAGDNRAEIEQVIARYEGTDTAGAARWLVGAMLGRNGRVGAGMDSLEAIYAQLPNGADWQLDSAQLARGRNFANMSLEKISDAAAVTADYLISNLRDAYRLRDSRKWNERLSDEQFCELLLPYRIGDEPLSDWRGLTVGGSRRLKIR